MSATPLMKSTILPICCTRLFSFTTASAIARLSSCIRCIDWENASAESWPSCAASSVFWASPETAPALSAICRAERASSSVVAEVWFSAAACSAAPASWRAEVETISPAVSPICCPAPLSWPITSRMCPCIAENATETAQTSSSAGITFEPASFPSAIATASSAISRSGPPSALPTSQAANIATATTSAQRIATET